VEKHREVFQALKEEEKLEKQEKRPNKFIKEKTKNRPSPGN
jgi:hypothetical protein